MKNTVLIMPTLKDMIMARFDKPNVLMNARDHFQSLLCDSPTEKDPVLACVNPGKHVSCVRPETVKELEDHVKNCIGFNESLILDEEREKDSAEEK